MAKRVPQDEKPFRPVDEALVRSVMSGSAYSPGEGGNTAVEMPPPASEPKPRPVPSIARHPEPTPAPARTETERSVARAVDPELEKRNREKRVLLTRAEERDIERLVSRVAGELGTPVKLSHLLRASITILLHSEEELIERTKRASLIRPGNGNAPELAEFEHGIAQVLSSAFREARPLR